MVRCFVVSEESIPNVQKIITHCSLEIEQKTSGVRCRIVDFRIPGNVARFSRVRPEDSLIQSSPPMLKEDAYLGFQGKIAPDLKCETASWSVSSQFPPQLPAKTVVRLTNRVVR